MKGKLRICLMSSWPSVHTHYWLNALVRRGHEVHFLLPHQQSIDLGALPEGIRLHRLGKSPLIKGTGPLLLSLELRRKLREITPQIFHIHSVFAVRGWRMLPWALAMSSFHPLVLTAWGGDLLSTPEISSSGRFFVKVALRSADIITADSESLLSAAQKLGAAKEKLHEIQFGVDTETFKPEVETGQMRLLLELGGGPVIYSPRAFMPIYNQVKIAEAIPLVLQRFPEAHFIFKRRPDHHSEDNEAEVLKIIETHGVSNSVRFVGELAYDQLPALYALSDVVVSVPDFDGTPRSVLEAMSCGAFPVVSNIAALHEWIQDEENGLFVDEPNAHQIATAIVKSLTAPDMLKTSGSRNREIVGKRASSNFWFGKMEELYYRVATSGLERGK